MKIVKAAFISLAALAFALSPTIASAQRSHGTSAHFRPVLTHPRAPQMHDHGESAHHS